MAYRNNLSTQISMDDSFEKTKESCVEIMGKGFCGLCVSFN